MPVWKGFVTVDGKEYELAMWPARSGKPDAYSGTLKPKQARPAGGGYAPSYNPPVTTYPTIEPTYEPELDDEIPF